MISTICRSGLDDLGREGVRVFLGFVESVLKQKDVVVLAIPGGRSVGCIWSLLADEKAVPWSKIHVFMVDERIVAPNHEDGNYRLAFEKFLKVLIESGRLPAENVHPFIPKDSEDKGSGEYYGEMKKIGDPDVLILGAGEDGHVGALYPNHHSIKNDSEGYFFMKDSPKKPSERMTMTRNTMLKAQAAILLFVGEGKKDAYADFLKGDEVLGCPARLVKKISSACVLTDLKRDQG